MAQLPKIFVVSTGNDASDGSRNAPKRNFQAAHDAVAANGQIVVLDTAGYGAVTITKSIAITVPPGVNGFVTVSGGGNGITINAATTDVVQLRGLIVEGNGSGTGIRVSSLLTLEVADCTVRRFATGIDFAVTNSADLQIDNSVCRECSTGLRVARPGVFNLRAFATHCRFLSNGNGAAAITTGSTVVEFANLVLTDCEIANNTSFGVSVSGPLASARLDRCQVTNNFAGIGRPSADGVLGTLGNNTFADNQIADGTFTNTIAPK